MIEYILLGIAVILVIYGIYIYNRLVRMRNWVREAWSQIDVQLKRRHDLIPNLVETVKGYAKHQQALKSIFALGEAYPDLKANQNFLQLQEELTTTENKVAYSRQLYNKTVADYNTLREQFPSNLIANMFNFREEQLLAIPEEERTVPIVKF